MTQPSTENQHMDTLVDRRRHDFFIVDNAIFEMGLSPFELAVYCALARHADRSGVSWPGVPYIASMTGMSERKVRDCLTRLQSLNLIDVAPNYREDGGQTSNTYILYPPVPPAPHAAPPLHVVQSPPACGAGKQDSEEQEDGDEAATPGASVEEKAPEPDPEQGARRAALDKLQQRGLFNPTMLAQFDDMWPELYGLRLGWIDDAIAVADHAKAYSPAYILKVLANALHTDKPPSIPTPRTASNGKPKAGNDYQAKMALLGL